MAEWMADGLLVEMEMEVCHDSFSLSFSGFYGNFIWMTYLHGGERWMERWQGGRSSRIVCSGEEIGHHSKIFTREKSMAVCIQDPSLAAKGPKGSILCDF